MINIERRLVSLALVVVFLLLVLSIPVAGEDTTLTGTIHEIYDVAATNLTQTDGTIIWKTHDDATSQVFYDTQYHGDINDYAQSTTEDPTLVSNHSVPVAGLTGSTTYHYRVRSVANSTEYVSEDYTFTTAGGGGSGGGGGGGGPAPEGYNFINPYIIRLNGLLVYPFFAESEDGNISMEFATGTICLDRYGYALSYVSIVPLDESKWPQPPAGATIIVVYDFGPNGATFEESGTLTVIYDDSPIFNGINEEDLVIAYWDADAEEWVVLEDCVVDPETNTITATLRHFTIFAVLGYEEEVEPVAPATFELSSLTISPAEVEIGEEVVLSVTVTNTGEQSGNYEVSLKIDGELVVTKEIVDLAGGSEQIVTFTTARDADGTYTVDVNGETGTFAVKPVSPGVPPSVPPTVPTSHRTVVPAEVDIVENMTISTVVTNTGDSTGTHELTFKVDNEVVSTENIILVGGGTREVTYTTPFPVELEIGESIAISALVANTGATAGTHEVTLKVDDTVVATKHITLPGSTNEDATFITTKESDKTYTLSIDALSGTITVQRLPPPKSDQSLTPFIITGIIAAIASAGTTIYLRIRSQRSN